MNEFVKDLQSLGGNLTFKSCMIPLDMEARLLKRFYVKYVTKLTIFNMKTYILKVLTIFLSSKDLSKKVGMFHVLSIHNIDRGPKSSS